MGRAGGPPEPRLANSDPSPRPDEPVDWMLKCTDLYSSWYTVQGLTYLCPEPIVVALVILALTSSVITGGVGFPSPARLAVSVLAIIVSFC